MSYITYKLFYILLLVIFVLTGGGRYNINAQTKNNGQKKAPATKAPATNDKITPPSRAIISTDVFFKPGKTFRKITIVVNGKKKTYKNVIIDKCDTIGIYFQKNIREDGTLSRRNLEFSPVTWDNLIKIETK